MNVRHPVGVLHLFSIKNIFMIKSNFRFFYFYFYLMMMFHSFIILQYILLNVYLNLSLINPAVPGVS